MSLLKFQNSVSPFRGLPVDDKGSASSITTVTGETVQLYYSNAGDLTADAGQAAGTMVVGQLAFNNVKNALGNMEATKADTSLSFTAGALTTEVAFDFTEFEGLDETSTVNRLTEIGKKLTTNGQYCVDYSNGTVYGRKTTTAATLAATTYKYQSNTTAGAGTITSIVPGTGATNLGKAEDSAHASGDTGIAVWSVRKDAATALAGADGDYAPLITDGNNNLWSTLGTYIRGEDPTYNVLKTQTRGTYTVPLTASGLVFTGAGQLMGFIVNSCAAGATLKVWDNTSAATTVVLDTMTFTAAVAQGPQVVMLPAAVQLNTGCYFTIAVAAMSVTPIWNQS